MVSAGPRFALCGASTRRGFVQIVGPEKDNRCYKIIMLYHLS